ncbi:prepronociceptin b [Eucyclogobius newberryi]|uniref:prepronociceptin b n=1 Tax=Eucyclogobius newberryi TaxID=166745 RepID=UPI003B58EA1C
MRSLVWSLLVLALGCMSSPVKADCQGECVACGILLQEQQMEQAFNTMVCLLECEGHVSSSLTWEVCKRAVPLSQQTAFTDAALLFKRAGEELASRDLSSDRERPLEQYESEERESRDAEEEQQEEEDEDVDEDSTSRAVSKRFGGFQRGRHGYRRIFSAPIRPLQKRYGGFIGVRKSARKWNSQKRVNQLLRQYLGMRSSRSGRPVTRVWREEDALAPAPLL